MATRHAIKSFTIDCSPTLNQNVSQNSIFALALCCCDFCFRRVSSMNGNWLRPTNSKQSRTGSLSQRAHKRSWICLKSSPLFKYHRLGGIRTIKFHCDLHDLDRFSFSRKKWLLVSYKKRVVSFWAYDQHKTCVRQTVNFKNLKTKRNHSKGYELWMSSLEKASSMGLRLTTCSTYDLFWLLCI